MAVRKKEILIIQSNPKPGKLSTDLNTLLSRRYRITCTGSFQEGISLLGKDKFDIIITNLETPSAKRNRMHPIRVIKKVDPDSVVIAVSSYSNSAHIQRALRLGAYDYISKLLNPKQILLTIDRAIGFKKLIVSRGKLIRDLEKGKGELEKKVRERTKELVFIYKIGQEISSTLELNKVLQSIVDKLGMVLGLEICAILLVDGSGRLLIKSARGLSSSALKQTSIKLGEGISGWVWEHKESLLLKDVDSDPRFANRKQERYYTKSLISAPLIVKNKVIGIININNKKSGDAFNDYDLRLIKEIATEAAIAIENANLFKSLQEVYMRTVATLASVIDAKDHYTRSHSENVTRYAVAIAKEMKLPPQELKTIREACQLHDLGKIGIHDYILTKPGKLTPEEWQEVKLHSLRGAEILAPLDFMGGISELVKQHHERYDGKGYPSQCQEEEIKLGARIMAVADAFDAMTSERPYRKKTYSVKQAMVEFKRCSGTQFDPRVVDVFLKILKKNPRIVPQDCARKKG